jgi:hypothetical protein
VGGGGGGWARVLGWKEKRASSQKKTLADIQCKEFVGHPGLK